MDNSIIVHENQNQPRENAIDLFLIMAILLVLSVAAILGFILISRPRSVVVSANVPTLQPVDDPIQSQLRGEMTESMAWEESGMMWTLQPRVGYQIAARVLGNKRYYDWESPTVPRDLALGWGDMSDPAVDEWINWRQSGRWYFYTWNGASPYDGRYISAHSANVHIIPATENLEKALRNIKENDFVLLEGRLVDIEARSDQQVRSVSTSLTRNDSGNGACEILYVERLTWNGRLYE
ncbi:MAG: hypothetical protein GY803_08535 [Chloroflexi bacterium]|nr:hypothetical protein [Chloroflexota bacterium]